MKNVSMLGRLAVLCVALTGNAYAQVAGNGAGTPPPAQPGFVSGPTYSPYQYWSPSGRMTNCGAPGSMTAIRTGSGGVGNPIAVDDGREIGGAPGMMTTRASASLGCAPAAAPVRSYPSSPGP